MARFVAEVDRFLERGILERILDDELVADDDGGVYKEDVGVDEVEYVDEVSDMSVDDADERFVDPVVEYGPSPRFISPKYCSESRTASSC